MRCHPNYFGRVSKNVVFGGGSIIFFVTRGFFFKLLEKFQFLSSFFINSFAGKAQLNLKSGF